MKKSLIVLALLLAYGTTAVALTPVAPTHPRAENAYLSQEDAAARSARVGNVDYTLEFALTGKETFSGTTTLAFDLSDASQPLTIDLDKATITSLTVNGKAVTPQYNQWFITLAPQDLKAGRNTVSYTHLTLPTIYSV